MTLSLAQYCLALRELMTIKDNLSIRQSSNVECIELKWNDPPLIKINGSFLEFIKSRGLAGIYALDLLLIYKFYSRYQIDKCRRALSRIGGLYGVYRRTLKFNSLYNDLQSISKTREVLREIHERFDYLEARLISDLLYFEMFEAFMDKLNLTKDIKDLKLIVSLLKGRESHRLLLDFLRNINIYSVNLLEQYVIASMIVQELSQSRKVEQGIIENLVPYANFINNAIGGGLKELFQYLKSSNVCRKSFSLSSFVEQALFSSELTEDAYNSAMRSYIKSYLKEILKREIKFRSIFLIVKNLVNAIRFCLYYELSRKVSIYFPLLDTLLHEDYIKRVAHTITEHIVSRGSSQLCARFLTKPISIKEFKHTHNLAIVIGSLKGFFKNLLWDLEKDSEEYRLISKFKVKVIGTFFDWLIADYNGLKARRGIIVNDRFIDEVTFVKPVPIHSCFILNLPTESERYLHKKFSEALEKYKVTLINPYIASLRADSKLLTHKLFETYNAIRGRLIEHPKYTFVQRDSTFSKVANEVLTFIKELDLKRIIVKPTHGTEGLYAKDFDLRRNSINELLNHIKLVLNFDDVIIEEFRGNMLYKGTLHFVVRINVSWNGKEFKVESGYAQIAPKENYGIATTSHGGRIININELFRNLYFKVNENCIKKYTLTKEDIDRIKKACVRVAEAINLGLCERDYLKYMGIDLVLEVKDFKVIPIVLEVNSRPSGLSYSYTLSYDYESDLGKANVIKNLIKYLEVTSHL